MDANPVIHVCEVRNGTSQHQLRILATRENVRGPIADYDVCWLEQSEKYGARQVARAMVRDFPRAAGCEGLFTWLLSQVNFQSPPLDENDNPVEMPQVTSEQLRRRADALVAEASDLWQQAKAMDAKKLVVAKKVIHARPGQPI